jgi:hypothetical protein
MKIINEEIKFLSQNYLNDKCLFELSEESIESNESLEESDGTKLCDFKPYDVNELFTFVDTNGTIVCWFRDKYSDYISRDIDTIIIQNCNIKNMEVKYLNSFGVEILLDTLVDNDESEVRIYLDDKINTGKIIFEITDIFEGTYISIGQIRVCQSIIDLVATTSTTVRDTVQDGQIRTYGGRLIKWTDYDKWSATVQIQNNSKTQYDLLKSYIIVDGFVTVIPWEDFESRDIYEVAISLKDFSYDINRWSGLYNLTLNLEAQENASY